MSAQLVAHFHQPDVSNGRNENLNLKIENTKRIAHDNNNFGHYRLRPLLNHGSNPRRSLTDTNQNPLPSSLPRNPVEIPSMNTLT